MAYPSNVDCDLVISINKDTPLYLLPPYTRNELNSLHKTISVFKNFISNGNKLFCSLKATKVVEKEG